MNRFQILRAAKKRRGLTVRDFKYWDLEDMVHISLLDKSYPKRGRGVGWPFYKISSRGRLSLKKMHEQRSKEN